jgi:hypothetical protein
MNKLDRKMLSDVIPIREQFVRSSRIDDAPETSQKLIYSNTIDQFLRTLAEHQLGDTPQGAFTWTGPYGSGKSTLAQSLLSFLVGSKEERDTASKCYYESTRSTLSKAFFKNVGSWTSVPIVGTKSSFKAALQDRLADLGVIPTERKFSGKELVEAIETFVRSEDKGSGLVLIVDEMGKFLEYAVSNDGDVYLYQLLAEAAARSGGRFVFIGILHQSIQEYAVTAIKRVRDEWGKVQGRFADIGLNLNSAEQIELISNAVNSDCAPSHQKVLSERFFKHLSATKRTPAKNLPNLLTRCWPLNPLTTYVLGPISKRSYGQNQRSIFTFLSSNEPLGFRAYLDTHQVGTVDKCGFSLPNLWDYLSLNWSGLISASQDSHSFSIAKETLGQLDEKLAAIDPDFAQLVDAIKSVHLLELTRHETGLSANHDTLAIALGISRPQAKRVVNKLVVANLVSVRSHNNSIFLHEGSDFNIDVALAEELELQNSIDLDRLGQEFLGSTVIAKRHFLETGSMRWADIAFADLEQSTSAIDDFSPSTGHFARFIVNIGNSGDAINEHVHNSELRQHFAVTTLELTEVDVDTIREFVALSRIGEHRAELSKDKIARREVYDRIDLRRQQIGNLISEKLTEATWDSPALDQEFKSASLAQIASNIANALYEHAPIVQNELINRMKVSASASRATKQFLYDLLEHEGEENLGYSSFPPERAIFETVLKDYGIYALKGGQWKLLDPEVANNEKAQRLAMLFTRTLNYLKIHKDRAVGLVEIYQKIWTQPPYGLKGGLLPIFSFLFAKIHASELVAYQDGVFSPELTQVDADYFLKSPKYCSLRYLDFDAKTKVLLEALAEIPPRLGQSIPRSTAPLDVARSLIALFDSVPPWTKKTAKVSHNAKLVRSLFARAIDPAQFTLIDIPNLFGEIDLRDEIALQEVLGKVEGALSELRTYQAHVMDDLRRHLLKEVGIPTASPASLERLHERAKNVQKMAGDNRMETFITNLSTLSMETSSIEKLAGMLVNKPAKLWIDNDVDKLFVEATNYARKFNTLETMGHIKGRKSSRNALSLVFHNSGDGHVRTEDIELSPEQVQEAMHLSEQISKLLAKENATVGFREMIAALAFLLKKEENNV